MQKAFEKIVERLEELKVDNSCPNCQYRETCGKVQETASESTDLCGATMKALAIEIANQVAEEYNNESVKGDLISRSATIKALEEGVFVPDWNLALAQAIVSKQPTVPVDDDWIPCSSGKMPMEHDSIFADYKGTRKWNDAMFEKISDEVNITVADENGNSTTTHAHTVDGKWKCDLLKWNKTCKVIAWQPLPAPYQPKGE